MVITGCNHLQFWLRNAISCVTFPVPQSRSTSEASHTMATGDMVEVCEGELMHLQGRVISVDGNKITMVPKHEDLKVNKRKN